MIDPETVEQWQEIVDTADALLKLDPARQFGLVDVRQCQALLRRGRTNGFKPSARNVARLVAAVSGSRALLEEMDAKRVIIGNRKPKTGNRLSIIDNRKPNRF